MKKYIILYALVIFLSIINLFGESKPAKGSITIKTDDHKSLEGNAVRMFFHHDNLEAYLETKSWYITKEFILQKGGVLFFDETTATFGAEFKMDGYWPVRLHTDNVPVMNDRKEWVPQNWDIQVLLRKMKNPRPLFVKSEVLSLSELNVRYGYDMERGALVRPHGTGVRSDVYLSMEGKLDREADEYDVTLKMSFPSEDDGVISVQNEIPPYLDQPLLLGQEAPPNGYQPLFSIRTFSHTTDGRQKVGQEPSKFEVMALEGLWFRTHTQNNPQTGTVSHARYGKMYYKFGGPLNFQFSKDPQDNQYKGSMAFTYFYAPDDSRSLEFNQQNLLPWREGFPIGYFPGDKH